MLRVVQPAVQTLLTSLTAVLYDGGDVRRRVGLRGAGSLASWHALPSKRLVAASEGSAQRYRVLIPDLPGYGRTPMLSEPTIELVGDRLTEALRERGASRLRAIAGFSTGAYRAFDLLVRCGVASNIVLSLGGMVSFDEAARAARLERARLLETDPSFITSEPLRATMLDLMLSANWRDSHPEDRDRVIGWARLASTTALAAELRSLAGARDLRPEIGELAMRVCVRVGELDRGAPPAWSEQIVASVSRGELDVVPACGHALVIEDLSATTQWVVDRVDAAS